MRIRLCRARTECESPDCRERAVFTLEAGCAPWQLANLCPDCLNRLGELCLGTLDELGLKKREAGTGVGEAFRPEDGKEEKSHER